LVLDPSFGVFGFLRGKKVQISKFFSQIFSLTPFIFDSPNQDVPSGNYFVNWQQNFMVNASFAANGGKCKIFQKCANF